MVKVLYFARLRESLNITSEEVDLPHDVATVAELMQYLAKRDDVWHQEFAGCRPLRAAVNQELVSNHAVIKTGDEIAFFPPVTGG